MPVNPPDDVDLIVAAWQRERPDLDVAPLQVLSRVSRLAKRLTWPAGGLRRARAGDMEFDVLAALRRTGALPALARRPGRGHLGDQRDDDQPGRPAARPRAGHATTVADRPARCSRRVDARRGAGGRRAMEALLTRERAVLAGLSEADRRALAGFLRELQAGLDAPSSCCAPARLCATARPSAATSRSRPTTALVAHLGGDPHPRDPARHGRGADSLGEFGLGQPVLFERLALGVDGAQVGGEAHHRRVIAGLSRHVRMNAPRLLGEPLQLTFDAGEISGPRAAGRIRGRRAGRGRPARTRSRNQSHLRLRGPGADPPAAAPAAPATAAPGGDRWPVTAHAAAVRAVAALTGGAGIPARSWRYWSTPPGRSRMRPSPRRATWRSVMRSSR